MDSEGEVLDAIYAATSDDERRAIELQMVKPTDNSARDGDLEEVSDDHEG